jgi:hypothetical protein
MCLDELRRGFAPRHGTGLVDEARAWREGARLALA